MFLDCCIATHCADVQLIDDSLMPRTTIPCSVLPRIGLGVDHDALRMNVIDLRTRCRVWHFERMVDFEAVVSTRLAAGLKHEPAFWLGQHGQGLAILQFNTYIGGIRCPEGKPGVFRVQQNGAVAPVIVCTQGHPLILNLVSCWSCSRFSSTGRDKALRRAPLPDAS